MFTVLLITTNPPPYIYVACFEYVVAYSLTYTMVSADFLAIMGYLHTTIYSHICGILLSRLDAAVLSMFAVLKTYYSYLTGRQADRLL